MRVTITILFLIISRLTFSQEDSKDKVLDTLSVSKHYKIEPEIFPDSLLRTQIFSLSPMKKTTETVNGLVLGIGHFDKNLNHIQKINGVNIDFNPFAVFVFMFYDPFRDNKSFFEEEDVILIHNGLNISAFGYLDGAVLNGVSFAMFHIGEKSNGFTIHGMYNSVYALNGFHIAGMYNSSEISNGVNISIYNKANLMKGLQVGLVNSSSEFTGLQIGLFNKTEKIKGLQIGFWNMNEKRSLPFINF